MLIKISCRKQCMTLLEVLIGLSLITLLMSVLFSFYGSFSLMEQEVEKQKQISYLWSRLDSRLMEIFQALIPPKKNESFFFTSSHPLANGPTLVFCYDNGNCILPDFANEDIARLYLNENGELVLATWPSVSRTSRPIPMMQEILMENLESIQFSFFSLPSGSSEKNALAETGWVSFWKGDEGQIAAMLQLSLKRKGIEEPAVLYYPLPTKEPPIEVRESL